MPSFTRHTASLVLHALPTQQKLVDYQNALLAVNNYAYAITQTSLPTLLNPQPDTNYGKFGAAFVPAKQHCLNWTNSILPTALQLPKTIAQSDRLFKLEDSMAQAYLKMLIADSTAPAAKKGLAEALQEMIGQVDGSVGVVDSLQTLLTQFTTNLSDDAKILNTIATGSLKDVGIDEKAIAGLTKHIEELHDRISMLNTWLTIDRIGMALSLFIGLIGLAVAFIPGAQGVGVGMMVGAGGGLLASIAGEIVLDLQIASAYGQIDYDKGKISDLHQDIILLQSVNTSFQRLLGANVAAVKALAEVKAIWTGLRETLAAAKTDLTTVGTDVTAEHYQAALDDLVAADAAWAELVEFANLLNGIKIQWIDAAGNTHDFADTSTQVTPGGSQITMMPTKQKVA